MPYPSETDKYSTEAIIIGKGVLQGDCYYSAKSATIQYDS